MDKQIKRKILFINSVCNGSTGKICKDLYDIATNEGYECCIAYGRGEAPNGYKTIKIGNEFDVYTHVAKTRLFDEHGFGSKRATTLFLKQVDLFKPDVIHLHNIHGYYINIELLFDYLKQHSEIKVIWTLHDCWAFTGHCSHYLYQNCNKWLYQCCQCPMKKEYPKSIFIDNSLKNYQRKKAIFNSTSNIIIVAVSEWLKDQVQLSYLKTKKIHVIRSGIDTNIYQYRKSDFRQKYEIEDKMIILGVANPWSNRKGLDDFIKLSTILDDKYKIILVGIDNKIKKTLPENILGIYKTNNSIELAELYSTADIFFNPTKEETFGLTNIEAQACGTTVVSYNAGGTSETLINENTYLINNIDEFISLLEKKDVMLRKSIGNHKKFDKYVRLRKYIQLYNDITGGNNENTSNRS